MKPAPFDYHAPRSLGEALELMGALGEQARPLAGGQSLVPMLSMRLARPAAIVDLNGIIELAYHRVEADALVVGALCRHRDIELDPEIERRCQAIAEAVPLIGHIGIRNRGTVVGSIAHADPAAEWPLFAMLLEATICVVGPRGEHHVKARDMFRGAFSTALLEGDVVTEIRFGWPPRGSGSAFVEVARRHGDFALGAAAAIVDLSADDMVREARVAIAGIEPVPTRLGETESALKGRVPSEEVFAAAAAAAIPSLQPVDDVHAPAVYRRGLAETLIRRALVTAAARARSSRS
jgi:aerobic carbon-monoxide dehydrogenase medium subunit